MMTDPYSVLGVSPTATHAEITHAYRRYLRDDHPDIRSRESNSEADERLRQVLGAYALLRDPRRRAAYDRAHRAHLEAGPDTSDAQRLRRRSAAAMGRTRAPALLIGPLLTLNDLLRRGRTECCRLHALGRCTGPLDDLLSSPRGRPVRVS